MYTMQDFWQDDFYKQCSPDSLFDCGDDCVLTDVNLSEASEDAVIKDYKSFPGYTTLHSDGDSYPNSPINDMDTEFADSMMTVNPSDVKVEPPSPSSTPALIPLHHHVAAKQEPEMVQVKQEPRQPTSVLKNPTIVITGGRNSSNPTTRLLVPKLPNNTTVKLESGERWRLGSTKILVSQGSQGSIKTRRTIDSHLISSSNSTGADGELFLTEEEKRTLVSEGYSIPKKLPLSKAEERSLKKIRRKIKNKISAQESRRKKKEYLDLLERKYEAIQEERDCWMTKCEELQMQNKELQTQLAGLLRRDNFSKQTAAPAHLPEIVDFDDVVVGHPQGSAVNDNSSTGNGSMVSDIIMVDNEKSMLPEISDPFDIDVD